jgi:hypothetical protein
MLSVLFCVGRVIVYYDDSDEDMEDFQIPAKKIVKKMKGTMVSPIICNSNIIHFSAVFGNRSGYLILRCFKFLYAVSNLGIVLKGTIQTNPMSKLIIQKHCRK